MINDKKHVIQYTFLFTNSLVNIGESKYYKNYSLDICKCL